MKQFTLLFAACLAGAVSAAHAAGWTTDLAGSLNRAKGENKLVLINFTGSDWCPACIKLKTQALASPQFHSYADNHLLLVEVDFPRYKAQSEGQLRANEALAKKYGVNAYPTLFLLNGDGAKVAMLERYSAPDDFIPHLKERVEANLPLNLARKAKDGEPSATLALFGGAPTAPPPKYKELALKSITGPKSRRLAMINNQTFAVGETALVRLGDGQVKVRCLEIADQSIVISIDGKEERRELKLSNAL